MSPPVNMDLAYHVVITKLLKNQRAPSHEDLERKILLSDGK